MVLPGSILHAWRKWVLLLFLKVIFFHTEILLETHYFPHSHSADLSWLLDLANPAMQFIFPIKKISQSCSLSFFSMTLPVWGLLGSVCHLSPAFTIFSCHGVRGRNQMCDQMEAAAMRRQKEKKIKSYFRGWTG